MPHTTLSGGFLALCRLIEKQKRDEPLSANLAVKANFASAYPRGVLLRASRCVEANAP